MTGRQLRDGRKHKGWTQQVAAAKLGVSQPYLALMENEGRRVPEKLARKVTQVYRLSLSLLPFETDCREAPRCEEQDIAGYLAGLGYPGLEYLRPAKKMNPAEALFAALNCYNLESRLTEALPWVVLEYPDLDWKWLIAAAKMHNLQNRLGFVTTMARKLAERSGNQSLARALRQHEAILERARLVHEDTLCHQSLSDAERSWIREKRPPEARHWNLLTDLLPEHLSYAG